MPLEAGDGFISGLVSTNPVNATDQVAQGDDHLRLLKVALKGTFPNLDGAVTVSPAELNILDGATLSTAELNILDGVTLTAAQINDAARLSAANVFTNAAAIQIQNNSGFLGFKNGAGTQQAYLNAINGDKVYLVVEANLPFGLYTNNVERLAVAADGALNFKSGSVTTAGDTADEVGYNGTPPNEQNGNYTLVLTDRGHTIYKASGGAGETITIPANGSVAFPVGTQLDIVNNGGGDLTIAITTDVLTWAVDGSAGARTLADNGWAVLKKVAATEWFITGTGLS